MNTGSNAQIINLSAMSNQERRDYNYAHMKKALEQIMNIANTTGAGLEEKYKGVVDVAFEALDRCFGAGFES